jgi:hypothetical protein
MVGIIYILTPSSSSHLLNSMCCECVQVHINKAKRDRETHAGVSFLYVYIYSPRPTGWQRRKRIHHQHRLDDDGTKGYIGAETILTTTQLVTTPSTVRPFSFVTVTRTLIFVSSLDKRKVVLICHRFFFPCREGFVSFGYSQLPATLFITPVCSLLLRKFQIF